MSSSSDLEAGITQEIIREKKKSAKKKKKPAVVAVDVAKNEGEDPHWAYKPPEGAVLLDHAVDAGAFDFGAIRDDEDTEIWLIRVPDSIKAKHLEGLEIDHPSSPRTARVGNLTRKNATYDIWSVADDDTDTVGGEELRGLSCLLPRKRKKGRLYVAPKHVSRHIVISAQPPVPTAPEHQSIVHQNPPRASYPKDMLRHSFIPYGARSEQSRSVDLPIDVDDETIDTEEKKAADIAPPPKEKSAKTKESKGKKRKVDGDLPKKSKKHKADI